MALCGLYRVENTGVTSQSINVTTCESGGACITGFTLDPGQILLVNYFSISSSDPDIVITTIYGGVTPYYTSFSSDCDSSAFYIVTDSSGSVFSSMTYTHYCFPTILPCDTGDKPVLSGCYKKMSTSGSLPAVTYVQYSAVEYPITSGITAAECTSVCSCGASPCENDYCISYTDTSYDGNYTFAGSYSGNSYWTGDTTPTYYIFNNGDEWCLSDSLGGTCLLSGKYPCISTCPDLCDSFFSSGICSTTTTTTSPCNVFDFNAIFECNITPTPSVTPTQTPTPTVTPTPTSSPYSIGLGARLFSEPASATPTSTPTPTPTPVIERPCNFSGDVTFTTFDAVVNCSNSFQFQDCVNGAMYFSSKPVNTPENIRLEKFMIFSALVGGIPKCISYLGTDIQVIGVDEIVLIAGPIGYSNVGDCVKCLPPTPTPTPTPSPSPLACECPEGYTLLEDGKTCEKIQTSLPKLPDKPIIIGNNFQLYPDPVAVGNRGLIVYENISNKEWPLITTPQSQGTPSNVTTPIGSLSIIPQVGVTNKNNSYSSISPAPLLLQGQHGVISLPNNTWPVTPWPPVNNPPNIPNINFAVPSPNPEQYFQVLTESSVVGGVLQLAGGNVVNVEYQRCNQPPTINSLWGTTSPNQSWLYNVCIWNDSVTPGSGNPLENTWVGITECIKITEEKTYYIIGTGNNALRISINGLLAVEMNNGDGARSSYNFNNCFPVDLTVGTHVISMDVGNFGGGANYGFEILDIPLNNLLSAVNYTTDIVPYVIFSSKNKRPRAFSITFTSGSDIITSSGNFLPTDVSAFVKFVSFVPSNTYITQVINSNTARISANAFASGTGTPAANPNGAGDGRIYFIFETGQKFETAINTGYQCPDGYIYSNCDGPQCIRISRESCSTTISKFNI